MIDKELKAKVKKQTEKWLKKWDGNCSICGKPVSKKDLFPDGRPDMINGAVVGDYIEVYGHPICVHNVERIVVGPNRLRIIALGPSPETSALQLPKQIQDKKFREEYIKKSQPQR